MKKSVIKKRILIIAAVLVAVALAVAFFTYTYIPDEEGSTENKTYKVKFETYNGQTIESKTVTEGNAVAMPLEYMEKAGYTFMGWYDGTKKWDFANDKVTKDTTLTARWNLYLSFTEAGDGSDGVWVTGCEFDVANVKIPSEYNGKKVTGIEWGFTHRKMLKTVEIPDTVTYISANAFNRCELLETVVIPKSVSVIEENAFALCSNLKKIYCEATEIPTAWDPDFNPVNAEIVLGYKGEEQ